MNRAMKREGAMPRRMMIVVLAAAVLVGGCELDLTNPNAATREEVFADLDGLIAASVGLQQIYASNVDEFVQASALVTDEWGTRSLALLAWTSLLTGENFDNSYGTVEGPWATSYRVIALSNDVIAAAPDVGLSASFSGAITALSHLYRGMALGQLYLNYEQAPLPTGADNPPAVPRAEILAQALAAFDAADDAWAGVNQSELGGFNDRVKGANFDVGATIDAMRARYNLFAGNLDAARSAAEAVPGNVLSQFDYEGVAENPIYDLSFDASYVAGIQSFVDEAEEGDQRVGFWLDLDAPAPQSNTDTALVQLGQYSAPGDPFPVFLPDEMTLIRAEVAARQDAEPVVWVESPVAAARDEVS